MLSRQDTSIHIAPVEWRMLSIEYKTVQLGERQYFDYRWIRRLDPCAYYQVTASKALLEAHAAAFHS
jgi:hypothetical protein